MPIFKLWSKRHQLPKKNPDIYQYDVLPDIFRRQVIHILTSTFGSYRMPYDPFTYWQAEPSANQRWKTLFFRYTREIGEFNLGKDPDVNPYLQCLQYIQSAETKQVLDFIDWVSISKWGTYKTN